MRWALPRQSWALPPPLHSLLSAQCPCMKWGPLALCISVLSELGTQAHQRGLGQPWKPQQMATSGFWGHQGALRGHGPCLMGSVCRRLPLRQWVSGDVTLG